MPLEDDAFSSVVLCFTLQMDPIEGVQCFSISPDCTDRFPEWLLSTTSRTNTAWFQALLWATTLAGWICGFFYLKSICLSSNKITLFERSSTKTNSKASTRWRRERRKETKRITFKMQMRTSWMARRAYRSHRLPPWYILPFQPDHGVSTKVLLPPYPSFESKLQNRSEILIWLQTNLLSQKLHSVQLTCPTPAWMAQQCAYLVMNPPSCWMAIK